MATHRSCELFVDAADDEAVLAHLEAHFGIRAKFGHLYLPGHELRVGRNTIAYRPARDPDDFTDWPTAVEVYADDESAVDRFAADLADHFRAMGHRVVVDCSDVPELPPS